MPAYPDLPVVPGLDDPIPNEEQERTERIGSLLWIAFGRGAAPAIVTERAALRGRELSRGFVRKNVRAEIVDGVPFPLERTLECAELCGIHAASESKGKPISDDHLEIAWLRVKNEMGAMIARARRISGWNRSREAEGVDESRGGGCS